MAEQSAPPNHDWEKELAPKVTRKSVIIATGVFFVWIGFLAILAVMRWFGSLQ